MKLIKTKIGLPNTCSVCGETQSGEWYATNEDAAFSGQGVCHKHVDKDGNYPPEKAAKAEKGNKGENIPEETSGETTADQPEG